MGNRKRIILVVFISLLVIGVFPFGSNTPIKYIERNSGQIKTEQVYGEAWLHWLYNNPVGQLSLYAIVKRKFLSDWYGKRMNRPKSAKKIANFVAKYHIDLSEAKQQQFESFNAFFSRELKPEARPINSNPNVLISPADGKVLAYQDISNQDFIVKGYRFNLYEFLDNDTLALLYNGGSLMIVRLCPTDYHRFHFPSDGKVIRRQKIKGPLFSVSPIALRKNVEIICRNKREYTQIETDHFGKIIMAEVGATMVGSIIQTYQSSRIKKGQEKGYFLFGGSTVVLLFEKNRIKIDKDLIKNTNHQLETEIKMGEGIATAIP